MATRGDQRSPPLVIAHRGFKAAFPENTLMAFRCALACGADALECDIRMSADGVPVVIHDAVLDRTTSGSGPVAALDWASLAGLDAGGWFGEGFENEPIPCLAELLELVASAVPPVRLLVEVKESADARPDAVASVVRTIREHDLVSRCVVQSFHPDVLLAAHRLEPSLERHLLVEGSVASLGLQFEDVPRLSSSARPLADLHQLIAAVNPSVLMADEALLHWLHGEGFRVHVWTVNAPDAMRELAELGVDGLITDDPLAARVVLGRPRLDDPRG
ncbi:MAG: glycerophosphodiester phosphodiesterase family protein [Candidatus Krumholzibacteriia bacterium]